ncbi:MAG: hypothetical protein IPK21_21930 [Haliscomenobacter sp.]|nr:hypothetical protein [Haliscomenobacter sp.]
MSIEFQVPSCQTRSGKKLFGLCDDPPPSQTTAYIDEADGSKWIAVVVNEYEYPVLFTAIDRCIEIRNPDGKMEKRCDGMLTYGSSVIFVELKQRGGAKSNAWIREAEGQLKNTISYFEETDLSEKYTLKMAYISNSEHPKFRASQIVRMEKFFSETTYILRIEARINLL